MNAILDGVALWLSDFHLMAMALLLGVLATLAVMRQLAGGGRRHGAADSAGRCRRTGGTANRT